MQLCRFELRESPGEARSGIFHENRLYETDGEKAIGVHDLSKIALLPPIQHAPSARFFEDDTAFAYRNPANFYGPLAELGVPTSRVGVEARVAFILKEAGEQISPDEAMDFVLGATLLLAPVMEDICEEERSRGRLPVRGVDLPYAIGPFLTIPEGSLETLFTQPYQLKVNGDVVAETEPFLPAVGEMLRSATEHTTALPGDLIVARKLMLPSVAASRLGRWLQPGDTVQLGSEPLGLLTVKFA